MQPIIDIAKRLGLTDDLLEPYGRAIAKIRLEVLDRFPIRKGKLILVTAITPTTSGEGKTVNTIGITQGLVKLGHNAVAALRQPSLDRRDQALVTHSRPTAAAQATAPW